MIFLMKKHSYEKNEKMCVGGSRGLGMLSTCLNIYPAVSSAPGINVMIHLVRNVSGPSPS